MAEMTASDATARSAAPAPRPGLDLRLAIVGVFVLFLASAAANLWNTRALASASADVLHSNAVLSTLGELQGLATDAETGQRGYLITGREEYLRPYEEATVRLDERLLDLARLFAHEAREGANDLAVLGARIQAKLTELEQTIQLHRMEGFAAAQSLVLTGRGKAEMDALRAEVRRLAAREVMRRDERIALREASYRFSVASTALVALLGTVTLLFVWRLVRRNRQARLALDDERERLRRVIDSMPAFVGVLGVDGTLLETNRVPLQAAGVSRADVVGRKFWDCPWWLDDDARLDLQAAFHRSVAGDSVRSEVVLATAGGGRMVLDLVLQPVLEAGRLVMVIPSATDVTERKRMEDALTEADRRKDEFLAMLAHELRNPLAPVRTGVQAIKRLVDDERLAPIISMMERQLRHLIRLVDDLLDVTRIVRGHIVLQRARVPLRTVLDGALEASRNLIEAGHHALEVDLEDSTLEVDVDETRMTQVFTNLLNNAAKYTPDGGSIRVHAARDGSQAVIRVLDDGVGLSTWMLPHVFDLFTQGPRTLDRSEGGLGIGLSLVRHLVALHGGSVEATSPGAGKGSTFTVRIPLAAG